jgi:hypothetical protein
VATLVETLARTNWFPFSSLGVPAWDDLGFWVIQCDMVGEVTTDATAGAGAGAESSGGGGGGGGAGAGGEPAEPSAGGRSNLFGGGRLPTGDRDLTDADEEAYHSAAEDEGAAAEGGGEVKADLLAQSPTVLQPKEAEDDEDDDGGASLKREHT